MNLKEVLHNVETNIQIESEILKILHNSNFPD